MHKTLIALVGLLFCATTLAPAIYAEQQTREPTEEERQELQAMLDERIAQFEAAMAAPAEIGVHEAAALFLAEAAGVPAGDDGRIELAKFLRDAADPAADKAIAEAFAGGAVEGYLRMHALSTAHELVADDDGLTALLESGAFDGATHEEIMAMLAPLGVDEDGAERNLELIQAYADPDRLLPEVQMGPWGQEHWDTLGVTATLVQLVVAGVSPVGGSNFLPHNFRITIAYIAAKVTAGMSGDWNRGNLWTQIDIDNMLGAAFDIRMNTDTLAVQLPLSLRVELHWQLLCWGWVCTYIFWVEVHAPQTVMAHDPVWEFAVPAMSGGLSTRAESSDILMVIYDRLGHIHTQKPREETSAPPSVPSVPPVPPTPALPDRPGLGDLGTQSPIANYYGLQGNFAAVPPTPPVPGTPADPYIPEMHKRQRGDFSTPGDSTGTTAGFTGHVTQAWHLNILAVRLSSAGVGTATGSEPPATFYYDSSSNIFTGSGLMYVKDYSVVNDLDL